jgi:hypothetical protein
MNSELVRVLCRPQGAHVVVQQMVSGVDNVDFSKLEPGDTWSALKIGKSGLSYGDTCPAGGQCCLEALPCVSPCSLPLSGGWRMVVALLVCSALYAGGGVAHAVRVRGVALDPGNARQLLPHAATWAALGGLVHDGIAFSVAAARGERASGTALLLPGEEEEVVEPVR